MAKPVVSSKDVKKVLDKQINGQLNPRKLLIEGEGKEKQGQVLKTKPKNLLINIKTK